MSLFDWDWLVWVLVIWLLILTFSLIFIGQRLPTSPITERPCIVIDDVKYCRVQ